MTKFNKRRREVNLKEDKHKTPGMGEFWEGSIVKLLRITWAGVKSFRKHRNTEEYLFLL